MIKNTFFSFLLLVSPLLTAAPTVLESADQKMIIQNKILAKVHGKTFSVLDVVKKMEVFIANNYPQYINSIPAKYQYFSSHWKETLLQMIDHELILADAEKLELKITDSEIRETLHDRFGPNLMATLDSLGLSYEEARAMIHSELVVQKMSWFKIHSKALQSVNSKDIQSAYTTYCAQNPPQEQWAYQVVSIKSAKEEIAKLVAQKVFDLCAEAPTNITSISEKLPSLLPLEISTQDYSINLSEELELDSKSISHAHKQALLSLAINSISAPVRQVSRADNSPVFRIFHLKNHTKTTTPSLRAMHETLQTRLIQEAVSKETTKYITKLRNRYGFDAKMLEETIAPDFQPFAIK